MMELTILKAVAWADIIVCRVLDAGQYIVGLALAWALIHLIHHCRNPDAAAQGTRQTREKMRRDDNVG